jgi:hypothetical protein
VSGACPTCPFGDEEGWSEVAEQAMSLGCLPCMGEVMAIKRDHDLNWGCHSAEPGEVRPCVGFVRECRERGVDYKAGRHLSYDQWYREGVPA